MCNRACVLSMVVQATDEAVPGARVERRSALDITTAATQTDTVVVLLPSVYDVPHNVASMTCPIT